MKYVLIWIVAFVGFLALSHLISGCTVAPAEQSQRGTPYNYDNTQPQDEDMAGNDAGSNECGPQGCNPNYASMDAGEAPTDNCGPWGCEVNYADAGSSPAPTYPECYDDLNCAAGFVCANGECVPSGGGLVIAGGPSDDEGAVDQAGSADAGEADAGSLAVAMVEGDAGELPTDGGETSADAGATSPDTGAVPEPAPEPTPLPEPECQSSTDCLNLEQCTDGVCVNAVAQCAVLACPAEKTSVVLWIGSRQTEVPCVTGRFSVVMKDACTWGWPQPSFKMNARNGDIWGEGAGVQLNCGELLATEPSPDNAAQAAGGVVAVHFTARHCI